MALPPDANRLQPDHLPTPFSADDIRAGCPLGRTIRLRVEALGAEPAHRRIRFVEVDSQTAVQEFASTDADGRPVGEAALRRSTWLELQHHASQPAAATSLDEVDLELPMGVEACWRYRVRDGDATAQFWFAKGRAGMPVQVEEWEGDRLVGRTLMIDDRVLPLD
jgi:hypothetical protein